jgi:histidine triad (HIT) family protein
MNCLFCRIIAGEIPAARVYEDERALAFRDINPQAPTHILIIPKKHIDSLNGATDEDEATLGRLQRLAAKLAAEEGLTDAGYRTVVNTGVDAGQTVFHIHVHLLGGRPMAWPPG